MTAAQEAAASRGERNLAETVRHHKAIEGKGGTGTQADRDLAGVGLGPSTDPATANTEDFDPDNYDLDPVTQIDPTDEVDEEVQVQKKGGPVMPRVRRYANGGGVVDDPSALPANGFGMGGNSGFDTSQIQRPQVALPMDMGSPFTPGFVSNAQRFDPANFRGHMDDWRTQFQDRMSQRRSAIRDYAGQFGQNNTMPRDQMRAAAQEARMAAHNMPGYAEGGMVDEEDLTQQAVPLTPGAIPMAAGTEQLAPPATAALPGGPTAGAGAMPAGPPPAGGAREAAPDGPGFSYQAAVDAAHAGLDAIEEDGDTPEPKKPAKTEAIPMAAGATEAEGPKGVKTPEGAMTVEEMLAMNPIADPKGASGERPRMSESDLTLARLAHAYEGSLKQAKPKLARDIAKSMMKTYEWMSNGYKNLGNAKAAQGDVDGAIGAFVRAYNYIPDGKDLKLQKLKSGRYAYQYTDKITGEVIRKGMATPDEILGVATKGFANRWADLVRAARDPDKVADPDVAEAVAGAPAGATEGGSDPAAGGVAGSQPSALPTGVTLEESKALAAKREAPAKEARTEKRALDKEDRAAKRTDARDAATAKRTDVRDATKAAARQAEVDQKRVDEMQSREEWTKENPATFVTRAEFDLLPPGAYVQRVDKDGNPIGESGLKKRKPQPATAQ
jgi:hypothetical protein